MLRSVTVEELDKLQLDEKNQLYWDGVRVVTETALTLPDYANWAIIATAAATVAMAAVMWLSYWKGPRRP